MWLFRKAPAPAKQPVAIGNFSLSAQLAGASGRSLQVAGYIYDDESQDQLNYRLDMMQEVIERQRVRCEIPELEAKRDQMMKHIEQMRDVITDLETRKNNGQHLSSQELQNVNTMRVNIRKMGEEIKKGEEAIAEARKKAGVLEEKKAA